MRRLMCKLQQATLLPRADCWRIVSWTTPLGLTAGLFWGLDGSAASRGEAVWLVGAAVRASLLPSNDRRGRAILSGFLWPPSKREAGYRSLGYRAASSEELDLAKS